ncbi:ethanolamine ammonia-lyase subunit EutC [Scleromatobacter humisilvae]|uniref:Ethanolamine ammonia-lyase small subunit n=1 Tax=Scleromatobacter humisilvae TaxID=2897159 RepID=A0A9X1YNZ7_9BURK|nr:ethanolamine ammonia-lyase subunit EutC [Scleromatobacter humisilvae]MCK9685086.1 ethanolamine ammonia-lyase subunit EutC [Scleromatobacter humisilvae]
MTRTLPDHPMHWDNGEEPEPAPTPPGDPWTALRRHTPARISLGRSGTSLPTAEVLRFAAAHALARDAVQLPLDVPTLIADLRAQGLDAAVVASRAGSRVEYLTRPDLGRQLAPASRDALAGDAGGGLCIVVGDGLSAVAAQTHAAALVAALRGVGIEASRLVVATQARVALGDEIGERLGASLVLVLLGERPGLSSPDSLGAYLTWAPKVGCIDSQRNCVSNIRPQGLPLAEAAARIAWLVRESQRRRLTGIELKDDSEMPAVGGYPTPEPPLI